ncbi:PepSY domain-containing protein [Shewanella fidelis]|uniref:PepSY domain-containing protein n=1 Tax=Shewanella fidelis TaxID=173509 RepID=A0AAW8NKG0_9GAMM|nr:PepSY domain-containing protein [Shewanella fidelis]MDR8523026.1 PepSY domain-containing protein [Shewanella fidelis]MDW4811648.1 PepSY domain-containing protein [Shewanella fidelis]MDW4815769.1 PepSY domain-containing protein [Shewanella fidelis]MDW4819859.1 PepSY domain-containing protein [Shewanella fidelis]MDW4824167.1 PepSY domain-containing protein [Shewanella fidelis]
MKTALSIILLSLSLLTVQTATASTVHAVTSMMATSMKANSQQQKLKVHSKEQALQLAKRQYRGKVLKVQSSRVNGNPGYSVKLLSNDGVVFYVKVDAKTGRVSRN